MSPWTGKSAGTTVDGIYCKIGTGEREEVVPLGDLKIRQSNPNFRLIHDYSEWFIGNLGEDPDDEDFDDAEDLDDEEEVDLETLPEAATLGLGAGLLHLFGLFTAVGAVLGPALATMIWARWAAGVGTAVVGLVMAIAARKDARKQPSRVMRFVETAVAATFGLVYGAICGVMAVAFIGAGLGVIAWPLLGRLPEHQAAGYPRLAPQWRDRRGLRRRRPGVLSQPGSSNQRALPWGADRTGLWRVDLSGSIGADSSLFQESVRTDLLENEVVIGRRATQPRHFPLYAQA